MQRKKIKNTHKFIRVDKFIWNWFQLNKIFLIDIHKYFQRFKDALIIVQIQMENVLKIFIIDDQPLAKFYRSLKIQLNFLLNWNSYLIWTNFK